MKHFTLKILEVLRPISDVVSIRFKQPGLKKIKYKAGQYLSVVVNINGRKYIRPYSLSSAPDVESYLEITIKRVENGIVSNYLCDHVQGGDSMELIEPMGNFGLTEKLEISESPLIFWGGGSGITPLISIIKSALHKNPKRSIMLFYGNKTSKSTIFLTELDLLMKQYVANFKIWHFYSRHAEDEKELSPYVSGRIKQESVIASCKEHNIFREASHYICGPQGIMDAVNSMLLDMHVETQNIHLEAFKIQLDEKQLQGLSDQIVKIEQNGRLTKVPVQKGKSILDAGLDAGLDINYSCQQGTCFLCKARLLAGNIKIIGSTGDTSAFEENDCLLCCSYPQSDDIKIEIP